MEEVVSEQFEQVAVPRLTPLRVTVILSRGVKGYTILVLSLLMKGLTTTLYNTRGSLRSLGDSAQFG
jgi:hypothetical protein